jgi:hypothetical protein
MSSLSASSIGIAETGCFDYLAAPVIGEQISTAEL